MGTSEGFASHVLDLLERGDNVWMRKMFGEYAIYSNEKVVAFLVDNQLFVKPTEAGRSFIGTPEEAAPWPSARPMFLVGDALEDDAWLVELVRRTAEALPAPKPKRPRAKKSARKAKG